MLKTPYIDLVPPLSTEEQNALKADIAQNGILVPIMIDENKAILDGHHRYKLRKKGSRVPTHEITGLNEEQKEAFVYRSINARRNLSKEQRQSLRKEMQKKARTWRKKDKRFWTQKRVAEELGVDRTTVSKWFTSNVNVHDTSNNGKSKTAESTKSKPDARVKLNQEQQKKIYDQVVGKNQSQQQVAADFGISQQRVSQVVSREKKNKERRNEIAKAKKKAKISGDLGVRVGDWREVAKDIRSGSVELIFTDPPYFSEYVPHYRELAKVSKRILVDGGSLVAYCGHALIPKILDAMKVPGMKFYWMCAVIHTGRQKTMPLTGQRVGWKPLIWMIKGKQRFDTSSIVPDTVISSQEKSRHKWQQSESEAKNFIQKLSTKGGLVFDPFCGSGTTAVVSRKLGRQWITCDVDDNAAKSARERIDAIGK